MTRPSPAIVAQAAVRPLPRWALWLLCLAYAVPGFIGRDPWRGDDMQAFAFMREIAIGQTHWLTPMLAGQPPDTNGLLPLWLGAGSIRLSNGWLPVELATRLPFMLLLVLILISTWRAVYHLALSPQAQPVAFAFGGEAQPRDYARAIADGALLALIATLGLAQFSHETTSHLTQLAGTALLLYAGATLPVRMTSRPVLAAGTGLLCLALSGAPGMAMLLGLGSAALAAGHARAAPSPAPARQAAAMLMTLTFITALLVGWLGLWRWRITLPGDAREWGSLLRLLVWFIWPTWLLALWTLWRWRHQLAGGASHIALPLWFALVALAATFGTQPADRALFQGLPAFAALAAFALPTLTRGFAAVIDWFTLLFFSLSAIVIWVIWLAVQTGVPAQPAANVARLAPGFESHFAPLPFAVAMLATLAWCALVRWRTARQRPAIWKSLVLPAGGAALGWVLLMTLWLPLLDYGRSYAPQVALLRQALQEPHDGQPLHDGDCVVGFGLDQPLMAALTYHGGLDMRLPNKGTHCRWAIADPDADANALEALSSDAWEQMAMVTRPTDRRDQLAVLRRRTR